MSDRKRDGFDIAWLAVGVLGGFLTAAAIILGAEILVSMWTDYPDGALSESGQLVLISAIGSISTIAGAALGYQMGRKGQDNDDLGQ